MPLERERRSASCRATERDGLGLPIVRSKRAASSFIRERERNRRLASYGLRKREMLLDLFYVSLRNVFPFVTSCVVTFHSFETLLLRQAVDYDICSVCGLFITPAAACRTALFRPLVARTIFSK